MHSIPSRKAIADAWALPGLATTNSLLLAKFRSFSIKSVLISKCRWLLFREYQAAKFKKQFSYINMFPYHLIINLFCVWSFICLLDHLSTSLIATIRISSSQIHMQQHDEKPGARKFTGHLQIRQIQYQIRQILANLRQSDRPDYFYFSNTLTSWVAATVSLPEFTSLLL